jgi:rhodanese-related sulfurtransferase
MKKTGLVVLAAFVLTLAAAVAPVSSRAAEVPRITAKVVEALLGNPEVVVIDVRRGSDYDGSSTKIKGAVRESEKDISWSGKYPKDKVLVLYCA